jgi:hypothetical protein
MASKRSPKQGEVQPKDDNQAIIARFEDADVLANDADIAIIQRTYRLLGKQANQVKETELFAASAEESFRTLSDNINSNLKELRSHPDSKTAQSLEEEILKLSGLASDLIESFKSRQEFEPSLSIIRPEIKLIDASLAYKYADLQSDVNNLTSFATLFLGTGIAALISLILTFFTDKNAVSLALYSTASLFSITVTAIFWMLASSANRKAKQARVILEASDNITEIKTANSQK